MMHELNPIRALIAVPTYNEEARIAALLKELEPWHNDVLLVDDASTDNTFAIIKKAGFRCYHHKLNEGLSGFYKVARDYTKLKSYTHLICLDGDGQHEPAFVPHFLETMQRHPFVIGNRFHTLKGIPPSKIASNLFAILLFRNFLNITLPDVACGFRGIKIDGTCKMPLTSRFGSIYEMIICQSENGASIGTVPISAIYHPNDPLNTKIDELQGLLETIIRYNPANEPKAMMDAIHRQSDFSAKLSGVEFVAEFQPPGAYRFSVNLSLAERMFGQLNNNLT
jgi:glycosyltransferase involved in cell wall biosynthesis